MSDLVLKHKTPCAECPFRRTSPRGWLGGQTPHEFLGAVEIAPGQHLYPSIVQACHCDRKMGDAAAEHNRLEDDGTGTYAYCAGSLIFDRNRVKFPDQGQPTLLKDTQTVFQWPHEFIEHHTIDRKENPRGK